MPSTIRKSHPSCFKPRILAVALAALLPPLAASAWADTTLFNAPIVSFGPTAASFDGSLNNPAVANAYTGLATPEKLAAALAGLRPLIAELPLITPPGPCWYCGSYGSITRNSPGYGGSIDYVSYGQSPTLITAGSDADLGAPGAPVTLAFSRLRLSGSFETGRDFIIGSSAFAASYAPGAFAGTQTRFEPEPFTSEDIWLELEQSTITGVWFEPGPAGFVLVDEEHAHFLIEDGQLLLHPEPEPAEIILYSQSAALPLNSTPLGGPGWINTDGHDLKITGVLTSHQKLYKEGEGTLWLTGANVWHAAPEIKAGVLKGDAASLDTDIVNAGLVSFAQLADGVYGHVVSGAGGLEKTGVGSLTLNQTQTYTGRTDILAGTLALGYRGQLPSLTLITMQSGASLDISGAEYGSHIGGLAGDGSVILGDNGLSISPVGDQTYSFAGAISGQGRVTINYGSGVQQFTGDNSYAGGTLIMGGKLAVAGDASLGAASSAVVLSNGGNLILLADMNTARVIRLEGYGGYLDSNGHDLTLTSALEGNGSVLTKKGAGTLFLTSAATFSGSVTVAEGTLALLGAGALNPASHVSVEYGVFDLSGADGDRQLRSVTGYDSAEIRLGGNSLTLSGGWGTFNGVISGQGGLTLDGSNTFQTLTGVNTYTGATTILAGTLRARTQSLSDRVINDGRLELFDYGDENSISAYSGDISGSGMLIKTDKSAIWLRGHNSYTGGTLVEKGVLIGNTDSLQGDIETRAGLAFYQVADGAYAGRVSGTGTLMSYGPGALTLSGDNSHTGGTAFSNTLRISRDANLGGAQSGLLIAGGTLVALDDLSLNRHVALGAAGARFDSNGYNITLNGRIDGPGGVTKLGDGVLFLAGEHGYTGATRVEQGGMVVNGSFAGDVEVLAGAWFEAKGRVGGDLMIAEGALFSAGNSPGVLEVAGDFIAAGEILVEIAGPDNHDFTRVSGIADLTGSTLHFVLLDGALPGNYSGLSFLSAAGGITGLDSVTYTFGAGLEGYRVALTGNQLFLAPVPEPETWALLLAGLGLVGFRARRKA